MIRLLTFLVARIRVVSEHVFLQPLMNRQACFNFVFVFCWYDGLTAYFGVTKVGELKKGQTNVISAALCHWIYVCSNAKHIVGASKVIGYFWFR